MDPIPIALPADLFAAAESRHYEGAIDDFALTAGVDRYLFNESVRWSVDITNTGDALLVTGTVTGRAQGVCARCLDPVTLDLSGDVEGFFLIEGQEAPEDLDGGEYEVLGPDRVIDLEPLITAALLLELPIVALCDPDCRGLCAQCGKNLNEGPCDCPSGESAETQRRNPFSVLKDFDFES